MNNQNFMSKNSTKICFAKKQKGITLVALVVTIIVLLILAGVSLSLVSGSNGILSRANNAVSKTEEAQLKEELQLGLAEIMMDYYIEGNGKTLQEYIIEQCNKPGNDGMLEVGNGIFSSIDGELYYTDSNGNVSMIQVTDKGEVSIEGSVSADGTVNDTNAPSVFATATTNTISLVIKDPLSGVAGWAYSATNTEPTTWNEVTGKPKSHSETITGLTNGTTYYVWAKDANGNKSLAKEVTTKNFDDLSYDVTWEGTIATITVKTPSMGVQFKISETEEWQDYSESNKPSVASNTTVYFQVTDGKNEKTYEAVKPLKKSTITYNANGGTGTFTETAEHTTNVEVNFTTKPTKANYELAGWSLKPTGYSADYDQRDGTTTFEMGTEDVTLYAIWKGTTKETMNPANYGDKVNYSANGVTDWQIFLKEGNNVYIIAADYVPNSGYTCLTKSGSYASYGSSQSQLVSALTTTSNWSAYASGFSGATATGGPTLDQFVKSYNAKHGTSYSNSTSQSPWRLSDTSDRLYVPLHNSSGGGLDGAFGYWLASPISNVGAEVWIQNGGQLYGGDKGSKRGVRPLVCLESTVKAQKSGSAWTLSN